MLPGVGGRACSVRRRIARSITTHNAIAVEAQKVRSMRSFEKWEISLDNADDAFWECSSDDDGNDSTSADEKTAKKSFSCLTSSASFLTWITLRHPSSVCSKRMPKDVERAGGQDFKRGALVFSRVCRAV